MNSKKLKQKIFTKTRDPQNIESVLQNIFESQLKIKSWKSSLKRLKTMFISPFPVKNMLIMELLRMDLIEFGQIQIPPGNIFNT